MPAPATPADLVELIRKSGLVPEDRLSDELVRLKATNTYPSTVDQLAQALIRAGLVTRFQAKQLKIGRYKRFEIAGKYRLLELLGVGGMGAVYLCEHMFMKRLVALKVLPVEKLGEQSALPRFYREARAVAALDHPNIVRAYDIDKFDQLHFLVMEYVDGYSLQEIIARNGPISPERAANYIAQAALGLQHAHELGMVHRDIKPGNLLLERTGVVKILDMGLAKFFDQKHDNVTEKFDNNSVLGTADYLAPEQAISNVVDIRADIYALGGSLYYLLTGQAPFPDGTVASKLMSHQTKEPKPVSAFRQDVPVELLAVLHQMMSKKVTERFQTPQDVVDALAYWTEYPISLPPEHEMPDLCPAVLAISGHANEKVKNAPSGSGVMLTRSGSGKPKSGYPIGTGPGSNPLLGDGPSSNSLRRPSGNSSARGLPQVDVNTGTASNTAPLHDGTVPNSTGFPFGPTDSSVEVFSTPPPDAESSSHGARSSSGGVATATPVYATKTILLLGVLVGLGLAILVGLFVLLLKYLL